MSRALGSRLTGPTSRTLPSLVNDGAAFLPGVLRHEAFGRHGVLVGAEPGGRIGVHWAVVDPRRHTLRVWEKDGDSYGDTARRLGASLFTNGPFGSYRGGSRSRSTAKATAAFVRHGLPPVVTGRRPAGEAWLDCARPYYSGDSADGHVVGSARAIHETRHSRPRLRYFGRAHGDGRGFDSYHIGRGDPPARGEFVGGLFGAIRDYEARSADAQRVLGTGTWGLAPVDEGDPVMAPLGLGAALDAYESTAADATAGATAASGPCTGVIVVLCHWGRVSDAAEMLVRARVRDAVRIDGNNSLLFGYGNTVVVGRRMPLRKQLLQRWGLAFWADTGAGH